MKKLALILIALALLPCSAWASRDSTLADTTVFKASKKVLFRNNVVLGAPYAPTTAFTGGRADTFYVNVLNLSRAVSQIGTGTAAAGLDSNVILNGGIAPADLSDTLNAAWKWAPRNLSDTTNAAWKWGRANIQTSAVDSGKISTFIGSSQVHPTVTGAHTFTGAITHSGTQTLIAADSTYQAWPYAVVIDSAGKGFTTAISTQTANKRSIYVRQGSYAATTISASHLLIVFEEKVTITDSLLITGSDNSLVFGPGASLQGTRISGSRNKIVFENGAVGKSIHLTGSASDNLVDGGGWGSVFTGTSVIAIEFLNNAVRNLVCNLKASASSQVAVRVTADSCSVVNVWATVSTANAAFIVDNNNAMIKDCLYTSGGGNMFQVNGKRTRVIGNRQGNTPVGSGEGMYIGGDYNSIIGNILEANLLCVAGGDSNVIAGNSIRAGITDNGTGNISANLNLSR